MVTVSKLLEQRVASRAATLLATVVLLPGSGQTVPERTTFAWEVPGSVRVVEEVRGSFPTRQQYRVSLRPTEDGYALTFSDYQLLEFEPEHPILRRRNELWGETRIVTTPRLSIGVDGGYRGVVDWDDCEAAHRRAELLWSAEPEEERVRALARLRANIGTPDLRASQEVYWGRPWEVWVGAWVDLELTPGETVNGTVTRTVGGRDVEAAFSLRHFGWRESGHYSLEKVFTVEGTAAADALYGESPILSQTGEPGDEPPIWTLQMQAKLDPRSLKPVRASLVESFDGVEESRIHYSFHWE